MTKSSVLAPQAARQVHTVGVHEAKTQLSRLLREVESGSEVHILRGGTLVAKLVSATEQPPRQFGTDLGRVWLADDFDAEDPTITKEFEGSELLSA